MRIPSNPNNFSSIFRHFKQKLSLANSYARRLLVPASRIIKLYCCQPGKRVYGGALASGKASGDSGNPSFSLRRDRILSTTC